MARLLFVVVLIALFTTAAEGARFVPLGQLAGSSNSQAQDISADGTIVVGTHSGSKAFRWTQATGIVYLGDGPFAGTSFPTNYANAISGDGTVIVGSYAAGAFKWTEAGGVEALPPRLNPAHGVSYDGSIVVGLNIPYQPSGYDYDVSWDGRVVVGQGYSEAYREEAGVHTWLGDLPGSDFGSGAYAVSPDGAIAVGYGTTLVNEGGQQISTALPIRWTEPEGMVALGQWHYGNARDISAGKIVIVGEGSVLKGTGYDRKAFRWTPATAMESIDELLLAQGINVAALGWTLSDAVATSANGRIIAGWGTNPQQGLEAWLVELDVPGDFDEDGNSDGSDFLIWQRGLGSTHDAADLADWRANLAFLNSLAASVTAVPETALGALLAPIIGLLMARRRKTASYAAA